MCIKFSLYFWTQFSICYARTTDATDCLHVRVELEVLGLEAQRKVVLHQLGLGGVEGHLVAGQPALVAQHGGRVNDGALQIQVTRQVDMLALIGRLQLAALLAAGSRGFFSLSLRNQKCIDNFPMQHTLV